GPAPGPWRRALLPAGQRRALAAAGSASGSGVGGRSGGESGGDRHRGTGAAASARCGAAVGGARRGSFVTRNAAAPAARRLSIGSGLRHAGPFPADQGVPAAMRCDNDLPMAEPRTVTTVVSVALAVVCASWAVYEIKHDEAPAAFRGTAAGASMVQPIAVITARARERAIDIGPPAIGTANAHEP